MIDKLSAFVREKRGDLSLREFAKLCGNISHTQIDSIERGIDPRTGKPVCPTIETLAKIAKGTNTTAAYLMALANNEENIFDPTKLSNYVELPAENKRIPIIGSVKCGPDGLAFEYLEGYVYIDDSYSGEIRAFRCRGDSMKDIGITDGDIAIVRIQETIECGELAIVTINGDEGTLKRVRKFDNGIILEAANPDYPPRVFTGKDLELIHIVGKVLETRKNWTGRTKL